MLTLGMFREATEHLRDDVVIDVDRLDMHALSLVTGPDVVTVVLAVIDDPIDLDDKITAEFMAKHIGHDFGPGIADETHERAVADFDPSRYFF